ncbi:MAG: DNA repair protein RadC [Spirochaeta sp.]|nr:DNA repair protein RadC [Spirochaeta sp.]
MEELHENTRMAEVPLDSRPRERLFAGGAAGLSDTELITILLGSGVKGRPVHAVAAEVVALFDRGGVPGLPDLELIPGMGPAKAAVVAAALEFSRRVYAPLPHRIRFPSDVYPLIRHYGDRKQELFLVLSMNGAHEVTATRIVSMGLVNRTLVHPREVFAEAIVDRATAVIVAHNHPSGRTEPSPEDREVTERLRRAGETLGIRLLDHIVFGPDRYYSFLENGDM